MISNHTSFTISSWCITAPPVSACLSATLPATLVLFPLPLSLFVGDSVLLVGVSFFSFLSAITYHNRQRQLSPTGIGDLFDMLLPMLVIYQEYVRNHHFSLQVLAECKQKEVFVKMLRRLEEKPLLQGRTLETFLTYPMHQVSRDKLLNMPRDAVYLFPWKKMKKNFPFQVPPSFGVFSILRIFVFVCLFPSHVRIA